MRRSTIVGFDSSRPVAVNQISATEWELIHKLVYHDIDKVITVPAGQTTDFASVPAVLRWFVNPLTGTAAAILHDYLWRVLAPAGDITWRDADRVLRQALGSLGVSGPRRWVMWAAVRWGSMISRRGGMRDWWKDAPKVVAVSVPGAVIASPTLLLLPSLLLFWLVEKVCGIRGQRAPRIVEET
jgi:hypothetical protein